MNILNAQARIRLVEADRCSVCPRCEIDKLLKVFSAWRRRRVSAEFEYEIEDLAGVLGDVGDVGIKGTVIYVKRTNRVFLKRTELPGLGRTELAQYLGCS